MNIKHYDKDDIRVFAVAGRVDAFGALTLSEALESAHSNGKFKMVLDMGLVEYLNSTGLHTLAAIQTQNQRKGGDLRLARLNPIVQRVFQIVGFRRYFRNYSSVDAALNGF